MCRERTAVDFDSVTIAAIEYDGERAGQAQSQMATMLSLEDDEVSAASTEETRDSHSPYNRSSLRLDRQ